MSVSKNWETRRHSFYNQRLIIIKKKHDKNSSMLFSFK
jgi:hypothetical protein